MSVKRNNIVLKNEQNTTMKKSCFLLLMTVLLVACKQGRQPDKEDGKPVITVTIEPLRYFTEAIAGDRFSVVSMVPKGASPETYDPTPQQLIDLAESKAYFRIGYIGFEQTWAEKLVENAPHLQFYDLSEGVELIGGHHHHHSLSPDPSPVGRGEVTDHSSADEESTLAPPPYGGGGRGGEAVEPHIWNSTANAQVIARNILHALIKMDEAGKMDYIARFKQLTRRIERTDSLIRQKLSAPDADRAFMIYHPALSYFARDYGLHQISIEADGKEPSPAHLKELINACKEEKVRVIFVQPEFDRRNAELIARQTGTRVVGINPLAYDWEEEMMKVAEQLVMKNEE